MLAAGTMSVYVQTHPLKALVSPIKGNIASSGEVSLLMPQLQYEISDD